jgi:hypothetical protein
MLSEGSGATENSLHGRNISGKACGTSEAVDEARRQRSGRQRIM